jgi:hypothetical protein
MLKQFGLNLYEFFGLLGLGVLLLGALVRELDKTTKDLSNLIDSINELWRKIRG